MTKRCLSLILIFQPRGTWSWICILISVLLGLFKKVFCGMRLYQDIARRVWIYLFRSWWCEEETYSDRGRNGIQSRGEQSWVGFTPIPSIVDSWASSPGCWKNLQTVHWDRHASVTNDQPLLAFGMNFLHLDVSCVSHSDYQRWHMLGANLCPVFEYVNLVVMS